MSSEENGEKNNEAPTDEAATKAVRKSKIMAPEGRDKSTQPRKTDYASKPGFRNLANTRSKASRKTRRRK